MREDERLKIIYETAVSIITRTPEAWAKYLSFAARIYKYPFDNALLVYAQEPDATMLATKELWKRVNRVPMEKARFIAVCEYRNARNSLKYLFDISKTTGNTIPKQWTADENMQTPLAMRLSQRYNLDTPYLNMVVGQLVHEAMEQSFEQYMQDFELDIEGHFFKGLPKDGLYSQIREITEASAQLFICSRCGVAAPKSCIQSLSTISHFDTIPLAARLGNIVTEVSKHILLEVERTVKLLEKERSKEHGEQIEPDIYRERWPALPEHQHRRRIGAHRSLPEQVRAGLDKQSPQKSSAEVYDPANDRKSGSDSPESGRRSLGTAGNNIPAAIDTEPAAENRGYTGKDPPPEQPAPDSRRNRHDGNRLKTEVSKQTTEKENPQKEPQGSFSMPESRDSLIPTADTTGGKETFPDGQKMTDEEYRRGYEYILTSTEMYPESMYHAIRKLFDTDMGISEKAASLSEVYHQYGNAEVREDMLYRAVLREDDGISFYMGSGYTYMPWFEIAVVIDALIADGLYPAPPELEDDVLTARIGSYNIPDELDDMPDIGIDREISNEDGYKSSEDEQYAIADSFLCQADKLYNGWTNTAVSLLSGDKTDEYALCELFKDIEEKTLPLANTFVECFAFEQKVTIRIYGGDDLEFTYKEIAERIKALMEIGDFPSTQVQKMPEPARDMEDLTPNTIDRPKQAPQQLDLFSFAPAASNDSDQTPDASFEPGEAILEDSIEAKTSPDEPGIPEASEKTSHPNPQNRINYRYSEEDNLYPPGAKSKYRNNIEAIRLLKYIESENRLATANEQKVLARYVGWGGLAGAFDSNAQGWEKEYQELLLLLDESEYRDARESILTAYYTGQELVRHIYMALERFGVTDGSKRKIIDPAMGSGNFYSVLPDNLKNAALTGVEIDSITGRLARQLYQQTDVKISGFETSGVKDESYDIAVGNVPFNDIRIFDRRYKNDYYVHDYFFIRTLDALKPGGIAALITSKGTLDKQDTSAREEMARRADLIGAIRLPDNTFTALSGTKVTTDILFFKKLPQRRDVPQSELPDWVFTDTRRSDYMRLNQYFIDHPDMMLGDMRFESGRFGRTEVCAAYGDKDLYALLKEVIGKLDAEFTAEPDEEQKPSMRIIQGEERKTLSAPEGINTFTYYIKEGILYYCSGGELIPQDITGKKLERITGLCGIRDALRKVIDIQSTEHYDLTSLQAAQTLLNERYDAFVKANGPINSKGNILAFSDDDTFPLLRSIEDYDKKSDTWNKAPIFHRATIRPRRLPDKADTALQALQISLNLKQKVDIPFMSGLYGKSSDEVIAELGDRIFLNPQKYYGNPYEGWELDEEYLSGYITDKLAYAMLKASENPELFDRNVKALQAVQPPPLLPGDIEYSIGSPWIPVSYYQQFMYETFGTYERNRGNENHQIGIEYMEYTNQWYISNKSAESGSVKVNQAYGSHRMNAYEILEATLNLQSVTIRDPIRYIDDNGKEQTKYVVNARETMIARGKQQQTKDAFKSWLFSDKDRSEALLKIYNDKFNNIRPRTYDGSHLIFPGMSDEVELRPHQLNVAARIIYNGTALMAHEVGAGKTAAMIAAGMYMKHYGIISKPVYVVPNHIIEQWTNEFLRFFPAANLLVTTERDFERKNRQRFVSKIAMGEYDAIIISHSQFEKIMISRERQEKLLTDQINRLSFIIDKMKQERGEHWSIKQIVIFQKNLKSRLERLANTDKKDGLINFEELGLDYMFVDEAHLYKNNFTYTKIRNVAGLSNASSQRAADMKLKCEYLQETYNGRGVTFATGTPISNSIAELYIMQMYLQPVELKRRGLDFFDNWAATFAQIVTSLEITPEGNGYRMRSRFARFHNLPELMNIFWLVADIQTEEMLGLPTPEIEGGKPQTVMTECTPFQKEVIKSYVQRSEDIRTKKVRPEQDNMLKLTHEAKLLSIDPRLLYPDAPNDPNSKFNTCIRNILEIWQESSDSHLTQLLFCDSGTPKSGEFNIYDETKKQLIGMGIHAEEIAFIHDCKTDAQREALFEKVRAGEVRVLLGSTQKMGMGTNVQDRLFAIHHLDCPWRPTDITQRNGRGKRQGNLNPIIRIFQYVTKGTFDSYLWQIQEQKLRYISQVMTGKSISRSCEDVDITVLNAAEVKAIATDNPLLLEKMNAENEVTRLQILRAAWQNEHTVMERNIAVHYPRKLKDCEENIARITQDMEMVKVPKGTDFLIELDGHKYGERVQAGKVLLTLVNLFKREFEKCPKGERKKIGSFCGLELQAGIGEYSMELVLKGQNTYSITLGDSDIGNITRLENMAEKLADVRARFEKAKGDTLIQLEEARREVSKPFQYEDELNQQSQRLTEINTRLEFKELADQDAVLEEQAAGGDKPARVLELEPAIAR